VLNIYQLSKVMKQRVLSVWHSDRSLAKTFDQLRRAERAKDRLAAIRAARMTARRTNQREHRRRQDD
jgi:hypothetical protein